MANPYQWLTFAQAKQELALRLGPGSDGASGFWTDVELGLYIKESLRVWNCLTAYWDESYAFTFTQVPGQNWYIANGTGSPRQPTLTDTDIYRMIEYHLLEPPTGGVWTGTNQFSLEDLSQACSRRRNEMLQASACNMSETSTAMLPNSTSVTLPDMVMDERRARWVPAPGQGNPITLHRSDAMGYQYFTPDYAQTVGNPERWDVIGTSPQIVALDAMTNVPSTLQVLGMEAGPDFTPPSSSPLLMPDDWSWVLKYGAMADILSKEQEGKDIERASYCRQRYEEGLKLMLHAPWLLYALVEGIRVAVQPVAGADHTNYEWQSKSGAYPELVIGGIDLYAVSPVPASPVSVLLQVVANAPVPSLDTDPIQVSRDVMDSILDESQHLALFKMGGAEFLSSLALHKSFMMVAMNTVSRLRMSGIFATTLRAIVDPQEQQQPRFSMAGAKG